MHDHLITDPLTHRTTSFEALRTDSFEALRTDGSTRSPFAPRIAPAPSEADMQVAAAQFDRGRIARRPSRFRRSRAVGAALLGVAMIALGACGSDEESAATAHSDHSTILPTEGLVGPEGDDGAADLAPEEYEIKLLDYSFVGLPEKMAAGSTLSIVNQSGAELHELVAYRLPDDEERSVEELIHLPEEEIVPALGAPATVLIAAPGGDQIPAVGDGTLDEPGRYAIICAIPTGVDPATYLQAAAASPGGPPDVPGGPPHLAHGMFAELEVL